MKNVVIDTNILVSSLWSKNSNPATIMKMIIERKLTPCYDYRILKEYTDVLNRPKFSFDTLETHSILQTVVNNGLSIVASTQDVLLIDEDDRPFYEVAKECNATLITGNKRHFPSEPFIMTVAEFLLMND